MGDLKIFTDGSGKTGKYCFLVDETNEVKFFEKQGITNNQAEYLAVIAALKAHKEDNITIYSDSELIVNQLNHEYAIKEDRLRELAQQVWNLMRGRNVTFVHVPRSKNKAGKVLG
jgi:ribonuclease HI